MFPSLYVHWRKLVAVNPVGIYPTTYKSEDSTGQMLVGLHAQKREPVWLQILQVGVVAWQFLAHRWERLCSYRSGRQRARHDTPSSTKESLCGYQSSRQGLWHSIELILGRVLRNDDCGCLSVFSMLSWLYCICLVTYSMMALKVNRKWHQYLQHPVSIFLFLMNYTRKTVSRNCQLSC